jgi:hypothetical protein
MSSSGDKTLFCPHITFRQAYRYKRASEKNQLSEEDITSIVSSSSGFVEDSSSHSHEGSGEPADLSMFCDNNQLSGRSEGGCLRKEVICEDCDSTEGSSPKLANHLWRCLDQRCRRLLCGKQGKNHSQYHFQVISKAI